MKTIPGSEIFSAIAGTPFGAVGIRTDAGVVLEMTYLPRHFHEKDPQDAVAEQAVRQLERYLAEPDFRFDLPLAQVGSIFQHKVWQAISSVPRGEVRTYGQIARQIGSAPRAVGQACGANWFPLVIPCHRVTAASGIGGFAHRDDSDGFHIGVKRWLLAHEGVTRF
ncbi:MAG TPA: methylated-DNA--[protein]-cysteine S-methyltransferase [Burkholderiaceae bacterium]